MGVFACGKYCLPLFSQVAFVVVGRGGGCDAKYSRRLRVFFFIAMVTLGVVCVDCFALFSLFTSFALFSHHEYIYFSIVVCVAVKPSNKGFVSVAAFCDFCFDWI